MLSTRSLILPSFDWNHRALFLSNTNRRKFAQGIRVAQHALVFESLRPKWFLSHTAILFQSICPVVLRFARMEK